MYVLVLANEDAVGTGYEGIAVPSYASGSLGEGEEAYGQRHGEVGGKGVGWNEWICGEPVRVKGGRVDIER